MTTFRKILAQVLPFCVLFLILFGALVTSHGAGLSVPDWPTTFNENMFTYPVHKWTGGIFWEHGHRLIASGIGFLTLTLTILILLTEKRKWLKVLSCFSLLAVIMQGVLGGLTVLYKLPIAVSTAHAVLAQSFLVMTIVMAYSYSKELQNKLLAGSQLNSKLLKFSIFASSAIYLQLVIGALMRHSSAGLAVPDFPKMGGSFIPSISTETVANINLQLNVLGYAPVDSLQVLIHLIHRFWALAVIFSVIMLIGYILLNSQQIGKKLTRHGAWIGCLVILQFALGIITVLSHKDPFITSFHVLLGAGLLGLTSLLAIRTYACKGSEKNSN